MKTFEEWIAENHPEMMDESRRLGMAAGLLAGVGGLMGGMNPAGAAERPAMTQADPAAQVQQTAPAKMYSSKPFDVNHAIEVLGIGPSFASKPNLVYNIMIRKWLQGKLKPSQWTAFNTHYSDNGDGTNKDGSPVRPPACC